MVAREDGESRQMGYVGREELVFGLLRMPIVFLLPSVPIPYKHIGSKNGRRYCKRNTYRCRTNPTLNIALPNDPVESTPHLSLAGPPTVACPGW